MKEKIQIYETPGIVISELQLASSWLISASVQESMITETDPYFDDSDE